MNSTPLPREIGLPNEHALVAAVLLSVHVPAKEV